MTTVWTNARIFTADPSLPWADALAWSDDRLVAVGTRAQVLAAVGDDAAVEDLGGALVVPGIIDAHFHTVMAGEALQRVDLELARDLTAIQSAVADHARRHPERPWVLGRGWLFDAVPDRQPTRAMLDAVVPDRPALLDSADYHFTWLNTAALEALGIDARTPDPVGGRVVRDQDGVATGLLEETAAERYAWRRLAELTGPEAQVEALRAIVAAAHACGITGVIDMGLDEGALHLLDQGERDGWLTLRVVGHLILDPEHSPEQRLAQVARAAELAASHRSPYVRVAGVKIVSDGTIDGCTAHLGRPYADGCQAPAIWGPDDLAPVVTAADAAGLQVAIHAIGDGAVRNALDAFEHAARVNGTAGRRHRVEHIEYAEPEDLMRFAPLGVTASMQPVHADPAIGDNWYSMLGDDRADHGFRWADLVASGARLAFGTDAPTAPFEPLPNLYIAATRRSALNPDVPQAPGADQVRTLPDALTHATADAAWSCFEEDQRGRVAPGLLADLVVVDPDVFDEPVDALLTAHVRRTVVSGRDVHRAD